MPYNKRTLARGYIARMRLLTPTDRPRLNEVVGIVLFFAAVAMVVALATYSPWDPSWNTATYLKAQNKIGRPGAWFADLSYTAFGLTAVLMPALLGVIAWKWFRSEAVETPWIRFIGWASLFLCVSALLGLGPDWRFFSGSVMAGGVLGLATAGYMEESLNLTGSLLLLSMGAILSLYLISSFSLTQFESWFARPVAWLQSLGERWSAWRAERRKVAEERRKEKAAAVAEARRVEKAEKKNGRRRKQDEASIDDSDDLPQTAMAGAAGASRGADSDDIPIRETLPWEDAKPAHAGEVDDDIPIRVLADFEPPSQQFNPPAAAPAVEVETRKRRSNTPAFRMPPTNLLCEAPERSAYDEQELKETAGRIKAKFEEFHVLGSVTQINPGPVVTTFEYKPEAGIKYSKIINLNEDLCLGLQAESILIERIPGKPTIGIEVPNSKREVISLRQVLESDEFNNSASRLTISLGKDISGRIKVATLDTMPHLLIAGSTGAGKSVMLNTLIMSILYKSTPDEVRMIMVDPKKLELGLYEGIPHLLTPVITDPKKATYALRNAVLEMERRLKLLAAQQVRNIDQYNKKVKAILAQPRSLFEQEQNAPELEELRPLPYILILIDELADLMMLERAGVEENVTRLAQMARAVGMHLVLATQRPSVDVITGLIKANFPARMSFRVATRVDSRTILDVMGAEHLLGKGDMLFLPPGSSRLVRVHGAFVSEDETQKVVEFWKAQAEPDYDQSFLIAPPSDDIDEPAEIVDGQEDPLYQDAVRVILEVGKASTSVLQRRLKLGYGRAARILDMMQREGIVGPPDGSKAREVLKKPDWLYEIEAQVR